ncbi:hypothetical protein J6590_106233, partial [Homalodisca vitripennis]
MTHSLARVTTTPSHRGITATTDSLTTRLVAPRHHPATQHPSFPPTRYSKYFLYISEGAIR